MTLQAPRPGELASVDADHVAAPVSTAAGWRPALVGLGVAVALVVAAYAQTAAEIVAHWLTDATYQFAFAVLPTLAYLLWHHRHRLAYFPPSGSVGGVAAAALAALAWLVAEMTNVAEGRQLALVAMVVALVLACVGWVAFRRLAPFLVLLAFLVPTGDYLLAPLKQMTVWMLQAAGTVAGLPVATDGYAVYVGDARYLVVADCAGLKYVLAGLFLGLTIGLVQQRSFAKATVICLVGGGIGVLANGLRVFCIVVVDRLAGTQMELSAHTPFHWLALAAMVVVLLAIARALSGRERHAGEGGGTERSASPPRGGRLAVSAAIAAAVVAVAIPQIAGPTVRTAIAAPPQPSLPQNLAGWSRRPTPTAWAPSAHLASTTATAAYERSGEVLNAFVAVAARAKDEITGASVDLVGKGGRWVLAKRGRQVVCLSGRCAPVHHLTLFAQGSKRVRHVYFAHLLGDRLVVSPIEVRLRRAWDALLGVGGGGGAMLLAVASDRPTGLTVEELEAAFAGFMPTSDDSDPL